MSAQQHNDELQIPAPGTITITHVNARVPGAIYIGRPMPQYKMAGSPLGNPFTVAQYGTRALPLYREWLLEMFTKRTIEAIAVRREFDRLFQRVNKGKDIVLACWCKKKAAPDAPCHGDVIKEFIEMAAKVHRGEA